jgi:DNA-binding NarL/FixJ family response regulator
MLVDDHEVVRKGLRSVIESAGDLEVVAEASVAEAIVQAQQSQSATAVSQYTPSIRNRNWICVKAEFNEILDDFMRQASAARTSRLV